MFFLPTFGLKIQWRDMKKRIFWGIWIGILALGACSSGYTLRSVNGGRLPISAVYDTDQDMEAWRILQSYRMQIDSLMEPVIGHAEKKLEVYRPESPLSNLLADILRQGAEEKIGVKADVGVMNMGGIRNLLNEGNITIGSIYEITPFENKLVVVTMKGEALLELFNQIAAVHGEGLSGASLVITEAGGLVSAKVGGKHVNPDKEYLVATIDYLAEGNDHLPAFKDAVAKTGFADAVLRDLFISYVKRCEEQGKWVDAQVEGRIVVLK